MKTTSLFVAVLSLSVAASCAHAPKPEPVAEPAPAPAVAKKPQLEAQAIASPSEDASAELDKALRAATVFFSFDRDELQPEGMSALQAVADVLRKHSALKIKVEGHCDERGTEEYNLALGQRRAVAAAKYLHALGVSDAQVETVSYGDLKPATDGHDEGSWAKNRRDEVKRN